MVSKEAKLARIDHLVERLSRIAEGSGQDAKEPTVLMPELLSGDSVVITVDRLEWLIGMAEMAYWGHPPQKGNDQ